MITVQKSFQTEMCYDLTRIGPPERLLFFDIETTGLSAYNSGLYLIGAVTVEEDGFLLRQWFSESLSDEQNVLRAFFAFAENYDILISFNGETFDIRFIEQLASQYGIPCPLGRMQSYDILKHLRAKRSLLPVPNFRQKTIERFLGIDREDPFTGGELISVYEDYCRTHDKKAEHFLLLHNEEDIKGMPAILPALTYQDALRSDFTVEDSGLRKDGSRLTAFLRFPFSFPNPLDYTFSDDISLHFEENRIEISIRLLQDELKFFYPDFRNYWFLTVEGYAIHKKLASFVDRAYRVPATAATCYTLMRGFFLPAIKDSGLQLFRREYRSQPAYHLLEDRPGFLETYLRALLRQI